MIIKNKYFLPLTEEIFDFLNDAWIFTKIDTENDYQSVQIWERVQWRAILQTRYINFDIWSSYNRIKFWYFCVIHISLKTCLKVVFYFSFLSLKIKTWRGKKTELKRSLTSVGQSLSMRSTAFWNLPISIVDLSKSMQYIILAHRHNQRGKAQNKKMSSFAEDIFFDSEG